MPIPGPPLPMLNITPLPFLPPVWKGLGGPRDELPALVTVPSGATTKPLLSTFAAATAAALVGPRGPKATPSLYLPGGEG